MIRINKIKLPIEHTEGDLIYKIEKLTGTKEKDWLFWEILSKGLDARKKNKIIYVYSVCLEVIHEEAILKRKQIMPYIKKEYISPQVIGTVDHPPIIIGSGPAGLLGAVLLAEAGLKPHIIERGKPLEERQKDVYGFFKTGVFNEASNIQFGEGGAGTFSDGKLTTGTHDVRIAKVLDTFIKAGADSEIKYLKKPHLGTDQLVKIIKNIRNYIKSLGGTYEFSTCLEGLKKDEGGNLRSVFLKKGDSIIERHCNGPLLLAIGHSARDTYRKLFDSGLTFERKPFAVGFRIEHQQDSINRVQYGSFKDQLPAADYKLNVKVGERGVYTFCMCLGGQVVAAASQKEALVTNGMSYKNRSLKNANAAVLVNVLDEDFSTDSVFAGLDFQEALEKKAYVLGGSNYHSPVQRTVDFVNNKPSVSLGNVEPSYSIGYKLVNLRDCLPEAIGETLAEGLKLMNLKLPGFISEDSILTGVETRSSAPVRIPRDQGMESNVKGLFSCGEGAGYAGGIVSAAVDGLRGAEAILKWYQL